MSGPAFLVVDTIGPWCACAVKVGDQIVMRAEEIGRGHAERLAPMVSEYWFMAHATQRAGLTRWYVPLGQADSMQSPIRAPTLSL